MKNLDTATRDYLRGRKAFIRHNLFWITAKNRETGAEESMGFWDGYDNLNIAVLSSITGTVINRDYFAFGSLLGVSPIPLVSDLTIRNVTVSLSHLSPEVQVAFRLYDPRLAPVEIHRVLLHEDTMLPVGPAHPRFIGYVNEAPIERPAVGGEGGISVTCVSHTRQLTKTNPGKRSDETQKLRGGDRFRRYSTIAGDVSFWWGEKKGSTAGTAIKAINEIYRRG
ncbi:hypothetical protein [Phyllobacterium endophyticum]|uniref:hypothetical protein n=1 Tax=Phyllobacterium endophyticum TaxID=1149773 RepID=UPI0016072AAA|nr:hypothetical protein [Phyllobacterium endophyticum]MBB3234445.1 hypothetical protein [Phyllobacterium endophyticum]